MSSQPVLPTNAPNDLQSVPDVARPAPAPDAPALPKPTIAEALLALALLAGGFYLWHFLGLAILAGRGIGTTLFFLYTLCCSFAYLYARGVRQNRKSLAMLAAAILGSLPFALYGSRDINFLLVGLETMLCLLWVMCACRTEISQRPNLTILGDLLNQCFIVPFANFGRFFTKSFSGTLFGSKKTVRYVFFATLGVLVSLPALFIVTGLLVASDDGFSGLMESALALFADVGFEPVNYLFELALAVPLAAFIFGSVYGNRHKLHTDKLGERSLLEGFNRAHAIPKAIIYTPLLLFVALYIIYFVAVGGYLFSGLQGKLPVVYTYAEYARKGFFELCAIAAINLVGIGGIWLFARRDDREYPPMLRVLTGILALLTCLLIVTALSKMFIYINAYGLTTLRIYTSWFMLLVLVVFCLIVAWHARPSNAARPALITALAFALTLGLTNTNAVVADHNVDRYLSGATEQMDIEQLRYLGYPAIPALNKLKEHSSDARIKDRADDAIAYIKDPSAGWIIYASNDWTEMNLEKLLAQSGR
ncbi:MAG TPA: hypothetical protein DEB24_05230 [Coriobacteriia bacterium]|nr:hypothetical protein [Coriobacteriia bacterium]